MKRIRCKPRSAWQQKVEETGLTYHSPDGNTYWDESANYQFSASEIDILEAAGNVMHQMYLRAAEHVIERNRFSELGIPQRAIPAILRSWERSDFFIYGRFDFAFDGSGPPKLLEYNADTPTGLIEAAVTQWYWLEETSPRADQFNSLHESLVAAWKSLPLPTGTVYFGATPGHIEDAQTVLYLQDTCHQAGISSESLPIDQLGFDSVKKRFVDLNGRIVENYFKLYPWEWMWEEPFSEYLPLDCCRFIEPMWKMLFSNKGMLPILWELFPDHAYLLPAYFSDTFFRARAMDYVSKPIFGREGANVEMFVGGRQAASTDGPYGEDRRVFQQCAPLVNFDGNHPICGVWTVDGGACGLGIREDTSPITGNLSRFVPHLFQ